MKNHSFYNDRIKYVVPRHIQDKKITSLSEFIARISYLQDNFVDLCLCSGYQVEGKNVLLYRGHFNCTFKLKARIYREGSNYDISNESQIYNEVLHNFPDKFQNDRDIINNLILMQHYEIPTRLIDLSFNPLVALFFAVGGYDLSSKDVDADDGEVLVFFCKHNSIPFSAHTNEFLLTGICQPDGYTEGSVIEMLSQPFVQLSLAHPSPNAITDNDIINRAIGELFAFIHKELLTLDTNYLLARKQIYNMEKQISFFSTFRNYPDNNYKVLTEDDLIKVQMVEINYKNLISQQIRQITSHFQLNLPVTMFGDYSSFIYKFAEDLIIKPSMNNERIKRQQGAFLIHPPILSDHDLIDGHLLVGDEILVTRIQIDQKSKARILTELEHVGITYSFLFPEIDKFSHEINRRISLPYCSLDNHAFRP